ncbi:hypothetical protein LY78DRAFT_26434 [Colletotrichum sublineola]|nr:hypothetical protein LY78DRAFT_26434 [Colletotrichum sublineola]
MSVFPFFSFSFYKERERETKGRRACQRERIFVWLMLRRQLASAVCASENGEGVHVCERKVPGGWTRGVCESMCVFGLCDAGSGWFVVLCVRMAAGEQRGMLGLKN